MRARRHAGLAVHNGSCRDRVRGPEPRARHVACECHALSTHLTPIPRGRSARFRDGERAARHRPLRPAAPRGRSARAGSNPPVEAAPGGRGPAWPIWFRCGGLSCRSRPAQRRHRAPTEKNFIPLLKSFFDFLTRFSPRERCAGCLNRVRHGRRTGRSPSCAPSYPSCSQEDLAMRTFDFAPLWRSTIGLIRRPISRLRRAVMRAGTTIPPATSDASKPSASALASHER